MEEQTNLKKMNPSLTKHKNSNSVSIFKLQFHKATKLDVLIMISAFICSIASGLSFPIFAYLFGQTLNEFVFIKNISESYLDKLTDFTKILIYVGSGMLIIVATMYILWEYNCYIITKRIKENYFKIIMKQEQTWFDTHNSFEYASKVQTETKNIENGLGMKVGLIVMALSMFAAAIVVGYITNWKLSLVISSFLPILIFLGWSMTRLVGNEMRNNQIAYQKASGIAEEVIYNIKTVSSFVNYEYEIKRFNEKLEESLKAGVKNGLKSGLIMGSVIFTIYAAYTLAIWFGSRIIYEQMKENTERNIFSGDILIVIFTIVFGALFLGQSTPNIQAIVLACNSARDYFDLSNRKSKIDLSKSIQKPLKETLKGKIEFRNVIFSYPAIPDRLIISGLHLLFQDGKKTAIVGESGSGKTTIVGLIERFYDTNSGEILIDDINIKFFDLEYLRSLIGYVHQEPVLFNTTIRENIIFGRENISEDEILEACKKSYADEFISKIPEGLDYIVGIKGSKLSGGQKQRIAIARAILTKPKILILDEATSALDTKSEKIVQKALDNVSSGITTIIIAHRLSTVINADKIVVLRNGKIIEQGNHRSLLSLGGFYSNLVKNQIPEGGNLNEDGLHHIEHREIVDNIDNNVIDFENNVINTQNKPNEEQSTLKNKEIKIPVKEEGKITKNSEKTENIPNRRQLIKKYKKKLWTILMNYKKILIMGAIFAAVTGATWTVYGILLADSIVALSYPNSQKMKADSFASAMYFLILAVVGGLSYFLQTYFFVSLGEHLAKRLRLMTFEKYLKLPIEFFDLPENTPGSLLTRLSTDTTRINGIAISMVGVTVQITVTLLSAIIISLIYEWRLALINLAFLPFIIINNAMEYQIKSGKSKQNENLELQAGSILSESVCNTKTIFSYNMQNKVVEMYLKVLTSKNKHLVRNFILGGLIYGFSEFIIYATYSVIFYSGAKFIVAGYTTFHLMLRAVFPLLMSAFGIGHSTQYVGDIQKANEALISIFTILEKPDFDGINKSFRKEIAGKIEFRDVIFAYPTRPNNLVLKKINFVIYPGMSVGIVGSSGCGKSTIIQLIERFYDPVSGQILIDDVDIKDYDIIYLRKQIGLVLQEPMLFLKSVDENIKYGKLDAVNEEVIESARNANILHLCSNNNIDPTGREGEARGNPVSGGEKQRISVARALIKNPKILLLDEATSALDKNSEEIVQKSIKHKMQGKTTIIVAHRLSTIEYCDLILVLDAGKIIEQGTHDTLYNIKSKYYELYISGDKYN